MFGIALPSIVALLSQTAPLIMQAASVAGAASSTISAIGTAIDVVEHIAPAVIQEATDLVPTIKNVIATLRGGGGTTQDQLDRLDAIEAKIDADYDAALAAAKAEDAAPSAG